MMGVLTILYREVAWNVCLNDAEVAYIQLLFIQAYICEESSGELVGGAC